MSLIQISSEKTTYTNKTGSFTHSLEMVLKDMKSFHLTNICIPNSWDTIHNLNNKFYYDIGNGEDYIELERGNYSIDDLIKHINNKFITKFQGTNNEIKITEIFNTDAEISGNVAPKENLTNSPKRRFEMIYKNNSVSSIFSIKNIKCKRICKMLGYSTESDLPFTDGHKTIYHNQAAGSSNILMAFNFETQNQMTGKLDNRYFYIPVNANKGSVIHYNGNQYNNKIYLQNKQNISDIQLSFREADLDNHILGGSQNLNNNPVICGGLDGIEWYITLQFYVN